MCVLHAAPFRTKMQIKHLTTSNFCLYYYYSEYYISIYANEQPLVFENHAQSKEKKIVKPSKKNRSKNQTTFYEEVQTRVERYTVKNLVIFFFDYW